VIELNDVFKIYENGTKALNGITMTIEDGEFVFIRGASGAGKSTLIKLLMYEDKPSEGEVIVNNFNLSKLKRSSIPLLRRSMGVVFQDFRLLQNLNVYDNVAFAMRVIGTHSREIRRRVPYVLGLVGLSTKAKNLPNELSGGEQQRTSLARALVNNPSLLIADEPTGNIDPSMSFEIMELFDEINRRGTTILMVTHDMTLVEKYNYHRVITIDNGIISEDLPRSD